MGRGKDKVIRETDLPNMSPGERQSLFNAAQMGRVKISGAAVVRSKGEIRYQDESQKGKYHEDKLS